MYQNCNKSSTIGQCLCTNYHIGFNCNPMQIFVAYSQFYSVTGHTNHNERTKLQLTASNVATPCLFVWFFIYFDIYVIIPSIREKKQPSYTNFRGYY